MFEEFMSARRELNFFSNGSWLFLPSISNTCDGQIMRRILRKIVAGEIDTLGDTSTLADPSVVDSLIEKVALTSKSK
jgi:acetyl-CoA synthetase